MPKIFCSFDYAYELDRMNRTIHTAQRLLTPWPENTRLTIRHRATGKRHYVYVYLLEKQPDGKNRSFYRKRESLPAISDLIRTYCAAKALKKAKELKRVLRDQPMNYDPYAIQTLYEDFYQAFGSLTPKPFLPNFLQIEHWCSQEVPCTYFPEKRTQPTLKGEPVRSKYEQAIADTLYELGIPYLYELPKIVNGQKHLPDFTILDPQNGSLVYIEAFGKMDEPNYSLGVVKKVHDYEADGLIQGKDLFLVFDSPESPFDPAAFRRLMQYRFHK